MRLSVVALFINPCQSLQPVFKIPHELGRSQFGIKKLAPVNESLTSKLEPVDIANLDMIHATGCVLVDMPCSLH